MPFTISVCQILAMMELRRTPESNISPSYILYDCPRSLSRKTKSNLQLFKASGNKCNYKWTIYHSFHSHSLAITIPDDINKSGNIHVITAKTLRSTRCNETSVALKTAGNCFFLVAAHCKMCSI